MKYKIFEIDTKREMKPDGYDLSSTYTHIIRDIEGAPFQMRKEFQYPDEAYLEIEKYAIELRYKTLTIIPIIDIDWEGKIAAK